MAGQTYQVNYIVNVDAANAQSAINSFKRAVSSMDKATKPIMDLQRQVRGLVETMSALNRGRYTVKIDTRPATQKIGKLIRALQMAKSEVQQLNAMGVTLGGASKGRAAASKKQTVPAPVGGSRARTTPARPATSRYTAPVTPTRRYTAPFSKGPTNLSYKLWGPTPLPNNGGMAIDMLKGMGIAYGIAGLGTMVSNIVDQAAEYDNLMKTVENILKSHDTKPDFDNRFSAMTSTVRNVGMETKFKVTEVADAAKFLAMAGLNVEGISQAIRPIADIALVGDTELGQTADLVTNIMTAYNIAPTRMRNAADVMTNTFTMSNATLTEIAEAYKYAASLLSAGGVPFEEATAAIGVLGDAGIKGSQAGTTLRTIMANVVNPTKKQKAAWDEIGVNRYNSDGSRKNLLEIFKELNQANVGVDTYYRLFHKTAASGAVALASHVGKWEDVYLENYLSKGLSAYLADEKKNTLQGLWAQLVSVFTDKGVTAFNGVQGQLRSLMNSAIAWLKTDEATAAFKSVSKTIMEFVHLIIGASKHFIDFYELCGPAIKAWMKFQLMIWPVVKAVTALRSVFLGLMGIRKIGLWVSSLATNFRTLGNSATYANTAMMRSARSAGVPASFIRAASVLNLSPSEQRFALTGQMRLWKGHSLKFGAQRPHYDQNLSWAENRQQFLKYKRAVNRRAGWMSAGNVAGGLAGAAALGYGMHKLTDDNDTWQDDTAGVMYGIAGTVAMVGGPWGWGIAAGAAIIGGIMQVLGSAAQSNKIYGELQEWAKQNVVNSGVIAGSESQTMKYLEAQYTTYSNINDLIQKRIELTAQLLGLQKGDNPMDASTGIFQSLMEKNKDLWNSDSVEAFNDIYRDKFKTDKRLIYHGGYYYLTTADSLVGNYVNEGGKSVYKVRGTNGEEAIRAGNGTTTGAEAAFASMAATAEIMAPGGYYEKYVEGMRMNVAKLGLKGASNEEFDAYINQIIHSNDPRYLKDLIGLSDIKDTDWTLQRMLQDEQTRQYMWSQLEELITPMKEAFHNFRNELATGELTSGTLANYIQHVIGDQPGLAVKDYDPTNVGGWFANYGYVNGGFDWRSVTDKNGITTVYSPDQAAQMAASDMQSIIDTIKMSGAAATPAGEELLRFSNILLTQAQMYQGATDQLIDVSQNQEVYINDILYRWNKELEVFEAIGSDGKVIQIETNVSAIGDALSKLGEATDYNWLGWADNLLGGLGSLFNWSSTPSSTQQTDPKNEGEESFNLFKPSTWFGGMKKTLTPLTATRQEVSNALANGAATTDKNKTTHNGQSNTHNATGRGTRSSDYKSHQKERAIPKQININIANLMKVDSIDLTNENNVAVIDRLKREIAYALYEAAADGTTMLNNLATS